MAWIGLRTIVEESAAQEAADSFMDRFPRFDEAWEALKWLLSRTPEVGKTQTGDDGKPTGFCLKVQASDELARTPELWVVYTYNDNEVVIHDLNAKAPPEEDEVYDSPSGTDT